VIEITVIQKLTLRLSEAELKNAELVKEIDAQCLLNAKGSQRESDLRGEIARLKVLNARLSDSNAKWFLKIAEIKNDK